jgi:alkanesulfonate monooxygenase SsuD/methylene tetrahydromethanopterin reductase-like flavin-dependent oxidoreductase (luciferase family)
MRIGIGLPAAVPGAAHHAIGEWAELSEVHGFASVGTLDRLVYDNLDPVVALAAAAARTRRIELMTTILTLPTRQNAVVAGKQLASLDLVSGGRLTAGLAIGGWPEDFAVSQLPQRGRGALFDDMLDTMRHVWAGDVAGAAGPIPPLPQGRPSVLLGGLVPASFTRVAAVADGWVAPFFGFDLLAQGIAGVREAWATAGRTGSPRIVAERYFCLGPDADSVADDYLMHYYGSDYFPAARADTLTTPEAIDDERGRLRDAGCDDLLLFPCSPNIEQVHRLAETLDRAMVAG